MLCCGKDREGKFCAECGKPLPECILALRGWIAALHAKAAKRAELSKDSKRHRSRVQLAERYKYWLEWIDKHIAE